MGDALAEEKRRLSAESFAPASEQGQESALRDVPLSLPRALQRALHHGGGPLVQAPVTRFTALPRALAALLVCVALLVAPRPARAETVHTVAKGQTLGAIAKRYRISVPALREANGLAPNARIFPGTRLVIPEKEKAADKGEKGKKAAAKEREGKEATPAKGAKAGPAKGRDGDKAKTGDGEPPGKPLTKAEKAANEVADARQYDGKAEADQKPKRPGLVRLRRGEERHEIQLLTRKGRLVAGALPKLRHALRHAPSAKETPIDPRLATLLGMVSNHFGGRTIEIVSGFRPYSPTQATPHSNHNLGRALDFRVEGISNTKLRDYCRTFRNAGVGYYPNSTFVHLDVRSAKTYWIDYSRPGERPRYSRAAPRPAPADAAEAESDAATEPEEGSNSTHPLPSEAGHGEGEDHPQGGDDAPTSPPVGQERPSPPGASQRPAESTPGSAERAPSPAPAPPAAGN